MITEAIQRYYPDWDPPPDTAVWCRTRCPFHGESNPSAAVSYDLEGFHCFACNVRGDAISIIRHMEEVTFEEAVRIAESLSVGGHVPVQRKPAKKSGRRVFGESGAKQRNTVRTGVRSRPRPWS